MNILITSASRKVSLIRAFQKALKQEGGGDVVAVDSNPLSAALHFADKSFLVPNNSAPNFLDTLLWLCHEHHIDLVVPTRDDELLFFAEKSDIFACENITVMVGTPATIRCCQDKHNFHDFCIDQGFAVPQRYEHHDDMRFPLFVKPRFGHGSVNTCCVHSHEELDIILAKVSDAILHEYISMSEYTVDIFADFTGTVISVVPRERIRTLSGESFVSRTFHNTILIDEAIRLSVALKLIGHNTIQCFFNGDKAIFIEVNPRFGGGAALGFAAGAPTPQYLVRLKQNKDVPPAIGAFIGGYTMLRYTSDLFVDDVERCIPHALALRKRGQDLDNG